MHTEELNEYIFADIILKLAIQINRHRAEHRHHPAAVHNDQEIVSDQDLSEAEQLVRKTLEYTSRNSRLAFPKSS